MPIDFFTPIVSENRQHQNFKVMTSPGLCRNEREVVIGWADGFIDRDGKAVKEFQTTFNSTFWELYLHASFRELGFNIDYNEEAPDFILSNDECQIIAEATIASHPDGFTAEWERDVSQKEIDNLNPEEIIELASVRLANAISAKHKKYLSSYSKLDHVKGKPYVICVAPFEQPFFFEQGDNAIRRVLYKFDRYLHTDIPEENDRIIHGETYIEKIVKSSGAEVELGFFRDSRMKEVSAIVFSCTATFGKLRALAQETDGEIFFIAKRYNKHGIHPFLIRETKESYRETLLDGLMIFINPYAEKSFPLTPFLNKEISIQYFEPLTEQYFVDTPHLFLFQRMCMGFLNSNKAEKLKERVSEGKPMMAHNAPDWEEGKLYEASAVSGPFSDHYLAHFLGWTVLIVRDQIDNDWCAQAISTRVKTLSRFVELNGTGEFLNLMSEEFRQSKEGAFEEIKKVISEFVKKA